MAARPRWGWYLIGPGVALGIVRLCLFVLRPHQYQAQVRHHESTSNEPAPEAYASVAALLDSSVADLKTTTDRDGMRHELSARLIQLAHDANAPGADVPKARDLAKAAYDADDASLHDDCPRLVARVRVVQDLARATSLEDGSALLTRRVHALCGSRAGEGSAP